MKTRDIHTTDPNVMQHNYFLLAQLEFIDCISIWSQVLLNGDDSSCANDSLVEEEL